MNSEKVKDIKEALELNEYYAIEYLSKSGEAKIFTFTDILTLINELESENERLSNALEDNVTAYKDGFQDGANLKDTIKNKLIKENKQLKNRIADLEKENEDYYGRLNNLETYIDNHEEIWKGNTKRALKQFAQRLKEKVKNFCGTEYENAYYDVTKSFACNDIDETLKEMIENDK